MRSDRGEGWVGPTGWAAPIEHEEETDSQMQISLNWPAAVFPKKLGGRLTSFIFG